MLSQQQDRLEVICVDSHKAILIVCHLKFNLSLLLFIYQCCEAWCNVSAFGDFILFEEIE